MAYLVGSLAIVAVVVAYVLGKTSGTIEATLSAQEDYGRIIALWRLAVENLEAALRVASENNAAAKEIIGIRDEAVRLHEENAETCERILKKQEAIIANQNATIQSLTDRLERADQGEWWKKGRQPDEPDLN